MNRLVQTLFVFSLSAVLGISVSGCVGVFVAGGATAANSAGSNLSLGTQVDDVTIKTKAINALNQYPELINHSNVEITVFNHIVLLLGQVPSESLSDDIAASIAKIPNVRMVYNRLTVGEPIGYVTYAKDTWITTKVKAELVGKVNPAQFKVVTENGVVYLIALTNEADGNMAALSAARVDGVKQVVRAYVFLPKTPEGPAPVEDTSGQ